MGHGRSVRDGLGGGALAAAAAPRASEEERRLDEFSPQRCQPAHGLPHANQWPQCLQRLLGTLGQLCHPVGEGALWLLAGLLFPLFEATPQRGALGRLGTAQRAEGGTGRAYRLLGATDASVELRSSRQRRWIQAGARGSGADPLFFGADGVSPGLDQCRNLGQNRSLLIVRGGLEVAGSQFEELVAGAAEAGLECSYGDGRRGGNPT